MEIPLHVQQGQVITGELRLAAHNRQSYDVFVTLTAPPLHPGQPPQQVLLSATYPSVLGMQQHASILDIVVRFMDTDAAVDTCPPNI